MAKKTKKALKKQQRMLQAAMAANGGGMGMGQAQGLLGGLAGLLPARGSERFLVGVLVGGAAAYLLSDEEMRGRVMKSGLKLYASLLGGLAEMKEQAADLQAELEAEQAGAS
ncbi:YtxH domain-containing protein [Azospirillum sp. RWY-5-1]|uniref:YtxH domain-containing protein n=1 Tax=Azospirillum oleiclasticum TaxID=2735135 RepID=A0ABX2TCG0_9PROT|nr:YtxH domain-containing protein [Azospirillum oleiclasticum]NYZ13659.1 YtxH domain-containing protein [Azospirillum oleiclasticum]NYZ20931.1 YtxH domain-containing protein [Azospirillum oleiclasticum]